MVAVIGNARFFALVIGMLMLLVLGSKWWSFGRAATVAVGWLLFHLVWDLLLRLGKAPQRAPWYLQKLTVGEGRYLLFLLLMSGFWTCENQLAMTLPEYIRDYVDSSDLVRTFSPLAGWVSGLFAKLGIDTSSWSKALLAQGRVKPEHLINLNSLGIIFLQVVISYAARKLPPLVTIVSGVLLTAASFLLFVPFGKHGTGWLVVVGVLSYSVGEMMASPKSKEYAGRIAPPDKVGLYMGYFYLCVALGNLFGGSAVRNRLSIPGSTWARGAVCLIDRICCLAADRGTASRQATLALLVFCGSTIAGCFCSPSRGSTDSPDPAECRHLRGAGDESRSLQRLSRRWPGDGADRRA
jgi:POT family proton-dependent oligopeptide transporter